MTEIKDLEKTLWATADKLRSNMDAAEYKHVVLGLIFLKYISDAFADMWGKLKEGKGENEGANPEDADEYMAHNIFFVAPQYAWRRCRTRQYLGQEAENEDMLPFAKKRSDLLRSYQGSLLSIQSLSLATLKTKRDRV
jgi:type I restriction enzyme M protein